MKLTDYPEVIVSGAPGWSTFHGWLIVKFLAADGWLKGVVSAEFDGKIETAVFDVRYIEEL